jgi:hypothetical protein
MREGETRAQIEPRESKRPLMPPAYVEGILETKGVAHCFLVFCSKF